jgi:hypothetical protein
MWTKVLDHVSGKRRHQLTQTRLLLPYSPNYYVVKLKWMHLELDPYIFTINTTAQNVFCGFNTAAIFIAVKASILILFFPLIIDYFVILQKMDSLWMLLRHKWPQILRYPRKTLRFYIAWNLGFVHLFWSDSRMRVRRAMFKLISRLLEL